MIINTSSSSSTSIIRATFDDDPRSMVQWNRAILLDESHKLDLWPWDQGPRPKRGKSRLNLHGTILEVTSIGLKDPPPQKKKAYDLKNQDAS
jgi:hypothetical protein